MQALRKQLQEWLTDQLRRGKQRIAQQPKPSAGPSRVLGDPQLGRQLRALGYVN